MSILRLCATVICSAVLITPLYAHAEAALGIVTGPKTGTYYALAKDIAEVAGRAGITIDVKTSEGSIDNIKRINSKENAALGVVQSDVLGFLSRSTSPESVKMASTLRMVFPLHNEEIHVLARDYIHSFDDLDGKRVAVGEDGSGNMLTAINLFSIMGVNPLQAKKVTPAQGVVAVLKGEIDAVIFVGGKPVRLFKNLEDLRLPENKKYSMMLEQVHFVPMDDPRLLKEYKPATITPEDYDFVYDSVPTVAVPAMMISFDFSKQKNRRRCDKIKLLSKLLRKALPELQKTGHPKWKDVDFDLDTVGWERDECAWPETAPKNVSKASVQKNSRENLMQIIGSN